MRFALAMGWCDGPRWLALLHDPLVPLDAGGRRALPRLRPPASRSHVLQRPRGVGKLNDTEVTRLSLVLLNVSRRAGGRSQTRRPAA